MTTTIFSARKILTMNPRRQPLPLALRRHDLDIAHRQIEQK